MILSFSITEPQIEGTLRLPMAGANAFEDLSGFKSLGSGNPYDALIGEAQGDPVLT